MRTMVLVYKNLQNWVILRVNVGKYSSTMEHMGHVSKVRSGSFVAHSHVRDLFGTYYEMLNLNDEY